MEEVRVDVDIRKIVPPKWWYIFLPRHWKHFLIYKKRKLNVVFTMEHPQNIKEMMSTSYNKHRVSKTKL